MKHLTTVALLLLAATPASAGFFDLFKSAETLAAEDHAYCVSIGTKGPTYTQCRMFMTQQRATYRNNAAAALADGLNSASNSF